MTGAEVREAVEALQQSPKELAFELDTSERSIRRWMSSGVTGPPAAALRWAARLHAMHLAWRKNEVTLRVMDGGFVVIMRDADIARQVTGISE